MIRRATIYVGKRSFSEVVDMDEEQQYFEESHEEGGPTWEHWSRSVLVYGNEGLESLNGNHLLYGWAEGLFESAASPMSALTYGNDGATWIFQFH